MCIGIYEFRVGKVKCVLLDLLELLWYLYLGFVLKFVVIYSVLKFVVLLYKYFMKYFIESINIF